MNSILTSEYSHQDEKVGEICGIRETSKYLRQGAGRGEGASKEGCKGDRFSISSQGKKRRNIYPAGTTQQGIAEMVTNAIIYTGNQRRRSLEGML